MSGPAVSGVAVSGAVVAGAELSGAELSGAELAVPRSAGEEETPLSVDVEMLESGTVTSKVGDDESLGADGDVPSGSPDATGTGQPADPAIVSTSTAIPTLAAHAVPDLTPRAHIPQWSSADSFEARLLIRMGRQIDPHSCR